jgi:hypothetical protein
MLSSLKTLHVQSFHLSHKGGFDMSRPKSAVCSSLFLAAICIVFMISACSKSSDNSNAPASNTGSVSFQLVWQQPSSGATTARRTPSFNACNDFALITIAATVASGVTTVSSGSWPCSLHEGLIQGIPAGTNYTVQISGISSGPTPTTWSGQASAITVITGQITDAGTIVMSYIGGDTTPPTAIIAPHSNSAITTNVPVTDRIDIAFNEPMAISTIAATNITLNNGSSVPGTVTYNGASNTAAFIPSAALAYDAQYVLQVVSCVTSSCIRDTAGNLLQSDYTFTFTAESAPSTTATAPSVVTAAAGNRQVTLDWHAANGATSYSVYYGTSTGVTTLVTPLSVDARPPFVHMNLTNGQTYYYIVTAANILYGESLPSTEVSATPGFPGSSPLPPAVLLVTPNGSQNIIAWSAVTGVTYNLYWSNGPIIPDKTAADNVIRNVTSPYIHTGTIAPTYCYIVTAVDSSGESADSMQFCSGSGGMSFIW